MIKRWSAGNLPNNLALSKRYAARANSTHVESLKLICAHNSLAIKPNVSARAAPLRADLRPSSGNPTWLDSAASAAHRPDNNIFTS